MEAEPSLGRRRLLMKAWMECLDGKAPTLHASRGPSRAFKCEGGLLAGGVWKEGLEGSWTAGDLFTCLRVPERTNRINLQVPFAAVQCVSAILNWNQNPERPSAIMPAVWPACSAGGRRICPNSTPQL